MVRLLIDCPVTLMTDNFIRAYSNIGQRSNQCSTGYVAFVGKVGEGGDVAVAHQHKIGHLLPYLEDH